MKNQLYLILVFVLFFNAVEARTLACSLSTDINGETIIQCDLPEVEIVAYKSEKQKHSYNTVNHNGNNIALVELPEVVINDGVGNYSSSTDFAFNFLESENNEPKAQVIEKSQLQKADAVYLTKKPFLNQMLNKLYDAGYHFLQTINEGLFFRS
jgi:hypothetical protein